MGKIAVDVVLLLPEAIRKEAQQTNKQLQGSDKSSPIVLGEEKTIPHLSLLMGCIDTSQLTEVNTLLRSIVQQYAKLPLTLRYLHTKTVEKEIPITEWSVSKTDQLQKLHETLVGRLRPYLSYDVSRDMFFGKEEVNDFTIDWVKNFLKNASFGNFMPHITLGIGQADEKKLDKPFYPRYIALCQLGNFCTCQKVLFKLSINSSRH